MTNKKGKDLIEEAIDKLVAYSEKAADTGLIIEVPMTPPFYPPVRYKRVEPGFWFIRLEGEEGWGPKLDDAFEYIFQAGIDAKNKPDIEVVEIDGQWHARSISTGLASIGGKTAAEAIGELIVAINGMENEYYIVGEAGE